MNVAELKKILKEVVKDTFREEIKELMLEAIKSNKQPIAEKYKVPTYQVPPNHIPNYSQMNSQPAPNVNLKQSYMDVLNEMKQGPKSPLEGEFQIPTGEINTTSEGSALPQGQLSLDMIANLLKK